MLKNVSDVVLYFTISETSLDVNCTVHRVRFDHPDATILVRIRRLYRKKKLDITAPSRDVTYQTLLFLPRESLVSDIPAGDGNVEKLFYGVRRLSLRKTAISS